MLAGAGAIAAGILAGGARGPGPANRLKPSAGLFDRVRENAGDGGAYLSPALTGGQYGWCLTIGGGGTCPTVPQQVAVAGVIGDEPGAREETLTVLLAQDVASVQVPGRQARLVTLPGRLPYGLRVAELLVSRRVPASSRRLPQSGRPSPPTPSTPQTLVAVDAHGRILARETTLDQTGLPTNMVRWWKRPRSLPSGPCQMRAHGLARLAGQWGHVAVAIRPFPGQIAGRAYFSCIDIEYYLHGWPLDAAILLDAARPGALPAPIPGVTPVRGAPGVFNGRGHWNGDLTARRSGNAWLVVAGGSGLAQRVQVLKHLRVTVRL